MALKTRDYSNLRETEHVLDAYNKHWLTVKDYSLESIINVFYNLSEDDIRHRMIRIEMDKRVFSGFSIDLRFEIESIIDKADENGHIPRVYVELDNLSISSLYVNKECLKDSIVELRIKDKTALVDLEELLKAIRYT